MNKAVFLDRDGVLNYDFGYVYAVENFQLMPSVIEALKILLDHDYKLVVITNQAGVARGFFDESDVRILHDYMTGILKRKGVCITQVYYCPHHPEGVIPEYRLKCSCRKPDCGMIKQAQADWNIDLNESILVGDKESDIIAGISAGVGSNILVESQYHTKGQSIPFDYLARDLYDAALFATS